MADAKQCDRCRTLYVVYKCKKNIAWIKTINYCDAVIDCYDLCPECSKFLSNWLYRIDDSKED